MMIPVMTLALVTQLTVTVADTVPRYNLGPVCRGISQNGGLDLQPGQSARHDYNSCLKSEMAMRRQLVRQWSSFKPANRANCIGETNAGGLPSYTGLLTCLQMAKAAGKLGQ
jgi:hypothetical protein